MPQAQAPLKPVPPTYVIVTNFSEDLLAKESEDLISNVRTELQGYGPLKVEPKWNPIENEMTLAFSAREHAEAACAELDGAFFNICIQEDNGTDAVGAEETTLNEFYDIVAQSKHNSGDTSKIDQSKQYVGVIKHLDIANGRAFIDSEELKAIANVLVYVHKNVFQSSGVHEGQKVRFRVHLNAKGLPQAQRPLEPVYEKMVGQQVALSGFPKEWSTFSGEQVAELIESLLTPFGPLVSAPTTNIAHGGGSATAVFEQLADATSAIQSLHGEAFQIRCVTQPTAQGRRGGRGGNSCALQIDGFPARWQSAEVSKLIRSAGHEGRSGTSLSVEMLTAEAASTGSARVKFPSATVAAQVARDLGDQKIAGAPLCVSREGEEVNGNMEDGERSMLVFIDELFMPQRPEVESAPTDREIWVDPLPDEVELPSWLTAFGKAEEVFRLRDHKTNLDADRGYIRFSTHAAARRCVAAGAGTWSESERALVSRSMESSGSGRKSSWNSGTSVYPISIVKRMMGNDRDGYPLQKICEQLALRRLRLRGEGLANAEKRLHFLAQGSDATLASLLPELEKLVAEIHGEIFLKIAEGWSPNFTAAAGEADDDFVIWRPPGAELPRGGLDDAGAGRSRRWSGEDRGEDEGVKRRRFSLYGKD